ncbi:MAG: hypothetical protein ABWK05_00450 [Pyrobaculum sp.]
MDRLGPLLKSVEEPVLRPLGDIENSAEGITELFSEQLGAQKPRVAVVANPLDECGGGGGACRGILGLYEPGVIKMNYRADLAALLHLYAHHLQALELGERFLHARRAEAERLPWELRPLEISAAFRSAQLARRAPPRVKRVWEEEIKPKIREIKPRQAEGRVGVPLQAGGDIR